MKQIHICKILKKEELISGIYKFSIQSEEIAKHAVPGQFLDIKCSEGIEPLLRRPISIAGVDRNNSLVEFIIQVRGNATKLLSEKEAGDELDVMGPLGNGFSLAEIKDKAAIVGGGIGIFPLLYLAKELKAAEKIVYMGFRSKELILLENEFKGAMCSVKISTDDGSYGHHGLVTELLENDLMLGGYDMIYSCGPQPMLKKVSDAAAKFKINCEISVEERMCCGVGACLGCACKLKTEDDWKYGHVCKDGPVFNSRDIILE